MYHIGQRWFSEGEPELGLAIVERIEAKMVHLFFPLANEFRTYNSKNSPLKRFSLEVGDDFTTTEESKHIISEIKEQNNIIFYVCGEQIIPETQLSAKLDLGGPLQRVLAKNFDSNRFADLRYTSYLKKRQYDQFKYKGFLGAKVRLIPHQVYVVDQVLQMDKPKVMLCDEVGLGKTIEAALILNSLIQKEIISNSIIIVPESLVNQWFIELYKKFGLSYKTVASQEDDDIDLETTHHVIISSKYLNQNRELHEFLSYKKWDMLIIDESHQYNFSDKENTTIEFLDHINKKTKSTLLLSATPEVMGAKNLFEQLQFLDPVKYNSFEKFHQMMTHSQELSALVRQRDLLSESSPHKKELAKYLSKSEIAQMSNETELKKTLIDRYGTGRNYFRNSRKNLENYSKLFNDRILHAKEINITSKLTDTTVLEHKLLYLHELLMGLGDEKVLIICHSKKIVLKLQQKLLELHQYKLACFHSDQSTIERDRQAAYFADDAGAQILISTEIGSEGRNFEFAHHLVLLDLPKLPDQLEQRIGRLDRIGQEQDINIHIPYIKGTFEEILYRWYNEVLNSFKSSPIGANEFYKEHQNDLREVIETKFSQDNLDMFISTKGSTYQTYKKQIEAGRDILIEENSYDDQVAKDLIAEISEFEKSNSPKSYFEDLCEAIGIRHEELNHKTYYIVPTENMLIPSYPGLSTEGLSVSYDREYSLKFDNIQLLNWEHALIKSAFEILLNSPLGNSSIIKQDILPRNIYLEVIVTLYCADEWKHLSSLLLPFTPVRVLVDVKGVDLTKKFPKKFIDQAASSLNSTELDILDNIPKAHMAQILKKATDIAEAKKKVYQKKADEQCSKQLESELARLKSLISDSVELETKSLLLTRKYQAIKASIAASITNVDSIRLILPSE